jgi:hypothetical protein
MVGAEEGITEEMAKSVSGQPEEKPDLSAERDARLEVAANEAMTAEIAAREAAAQQEAPVLEKERPGEYLASKFDSKAFVRAALGGVEDLAWTGASMRGALEANITADLERRVRGGQLDTPWFSFPPEVETREQKLQWAKSTAVGVANQAMGDTYLFRDCGRLVNSLQVAGLGHDEANRVAVYAAMNETKTKFPEPFGIRLARERPDDPDDKGRLNDPADGLLGLVAKAAAGDGAAAREASNKLQNLFVSKRRELAEISL